MVKDFFFFFSIYVPDIKHIPSLNHAKGRGCEDDFYFTDAKMKAQSINALSMVTQMAHTAELGSEFRCF